MAAPPSVLVIGGSGFIGQYLVERLLDAGQDVRTLDLGPSRFSHPGLTHWSGSFLQHELLHEAMTGVDCVYHLAATAMPREANLNPLRDCAENVVGTLGILDVALTRRVRRIVFSSSGGTVYGPTDIVPIPETHATNRLC
ncbi:MAG: UDP-glucose 4-epimerase [uncultured Rubellimicrobium sp.]|uniref:UDP-glucose 4-epimerase n=1 Tax=uncultured Rubellimicrobium sp. TaxID=543078 RepID=A0A6J4NDV5_9RHOB|nr:MAG: UDP-glucose 4-epimerase [uncultured Rubellimicrobium sp.]